MYKKADNIPQNVAEWLDNGDPTDMPFAAMEHIGYDLSAEEQLADRGLKREDALEMADADEKKFRQLLEVCGITETRQAPMWARLVPHCAERLTEERLSLLLRLISGYDPAERPEELEDDDIILRWISKTDQLYSYIAELKTRKKNTKRWRAIAEQAEKSRGKTCNIGDERFAGVFNMLCKEGYAEDLKDPDILRENLRNVAGLIKENPFLDPVEPLVYFQAFLRHKKKMLSNEVFTPNIGKLFGYFSYFSVKPDHDKKPNEDTVKEKHNRRAYCCWLYLDMMKCFPKADRELCDEGFLRCSDLSDWYYLFAEGGERIPLSIFGVVSGSSVMCIDPESGYDGSANALWEQVYDYRSKLDKSGKGALDKHDRRVLKAVDVIKFGDLERYLTNGASFFNEIWSGYSEKIKPQNYDVERAILAGGIDRRFNELLCGELCEILENYLVSEDELI